MILIDMNQISIASLMAQGKDFNYNFNENIVRHIVLNIIRSINVKFRYRFGDIILCYDSYGSWRKDVFPQYKYRRKESRTDSVFNWKEIFTILNKLRDEFDEYLPYKVIRISKCEADDIIAITTKHRSAAEDILIVSGDKDFHQLHLYAWQYIPFKSKSDVFRLNENDIDEQLNELIICGDKSDGIPNIKSPDNTFVDNVRQKSIRKKEIDVLLESNNIEAVISRLYGSEVVRNYKRNRMLISFEYIPEELCKSILIEFDKEKKANYNKLLKYMMINKMNQLLDCLEDFYLYKKVKT